MKIWKNSKQIVKIIEENWDSDLLDTIANSDELQMKNLLELFKEELWHEGYIQLETSHWKSTDYQKIRAAAKSQLEYMEKLDEIL